MKLSTAGILLVALVAVSTAAIAAGLAGFRRIDGVEITAMLDDIRIDNFDDGWSVEFAPDGTWTGAKHEYQYGESWGKWWVQDDRLCMETRQVDRFFPPEDTCLAIWVNEISAIVALGAASNPNELRIVMREAWGAIAPILKLRKQAANSETAPQRQDTASKSLPAPSPRPSAAGSRAPDLAEQRAALEQRRLALENERLANEEENIRQLARLRAVQLEQQRDALRDRARRKTGDRQTRVADTLPPAIRVTEILKTNRNFVTVSGSVLDNSRVSEVEINGTPVLFEGPENRFSIKRAVRIGETAIRVAAIDEWGNRSEKIIRVTRVPRIPNIDFGTYHALVIGNNNYPDLPNLKTAAADGRALAALLEKDYGFAVTLLIDATRDDILDAFDDLRTTIGKKDNLLVYYAGHGWLDKETGRGYWLATDARADRRSRWLSNATITDAVRGLAAKHVMVIADSCFSGSLTRNVTVRQRGPEYLQRMAAKRTRVVLSSGGLEPVEDSGGGKHSVFSAQLLKALTLNQAVMDGTQLFEKVRHNVVLNARQTPQYSDIRFAGHEGGDFLFVRKN